MLRTRMKIARDKSPLLYFLFRAVQKETRCVYIGVEGAGDWQACTREREREREELSGAVFSASEACARSFCGLTKVEEKEEMGEVGNGCAESRGFAAVEEEEEEEFQSFVVV